MMQEPERELELLLVEIKLVLHYCFFCATITNVVIGIGADPGIFKMIRLERYRASFVVGEAWSLRGCRCYLFKLRAVTPGEACFL